jgi:hypothetical protein
MTLPIFYYAKGTTWFWNWGGITVNNDLSGINLFGYQLGVAPPAIGGYLKALDGKTIAWGTEDPFPQFLNPALWRTKNVNYPAQTAFMGPSIVDGVNQIVADIKLQPVGTPVALGGYSQGAAVMSCVYNEFRNGRLRDRRSDLRAVVTFGNPMREAGHTYQGSSGYSGACDIFGDTRSGHGTFPALQDIPVVNPYVRQFARLQGTEEFFWDFTMPNETISGVGDSANGKKLVNNFTLQGLTQFPIFALAFIQEAAALWNNFGKAPLGVPQNADNLVQRIDALTGAISYVPGGGHIMYPFYPPPNSDGIIPGTGDTCFQMAAKYINSVGQKIYDQAHPTVPAPIYKPSYQWFSTLPGG